MTLPRCVLPGRTYLVTRRCMGRRFLLRPDEALNEAFVYCLARAAHKYGVQVHALVAMSNHYHLVLTDPQRALPDFMAWLNRQLAMCVKRLRHWDEVVWEPQKSYNAVELSGPSEALDKVAYTLLNPVSAALVRSPQRWPGALSTLETLRQGTMKAQRPSVWFKPSAPRQAHLELSVPPCFAEPHDYLQALQALLHNRLSQLRAELRRQGRCFLGRTRLRKTLVSAQPTTKEPRFGLHPTFSALTASAWHAAVRKLRAFRLAYRAAYEAWRRGDRGVEFPAGTWWVVRHAGATAAAAEP